MLEVKRYSRIWILILVYCSDATNSSEPCDFKDSVNITDGEPFSNGSYLHDGTLYPKELTGYFNYDFVNVTEKISVKRHLRGCIRNLKTCIPMCCEGSMVFYPFTKKCVEQNGHIDYQIPITNNENDVEYVDIQSSFKCIYRQPSCKWMYYLDPDVDNEGNSLFDNGSLFLHYTKETYTRDEYCISPSDLIYEDGDNKTWIFVLPMVCGIEEDKNKLFLYCLACFISIPFLVLTFIVYTIIAELRNLHGKIMCSLLISLILAYACLGYIYFNGGLNPGGHECFFVGNLTYYFSMASFFWLSVKSFDLWRNFSVTTVRHAHNEQKKFIFYSIFVWGLALLFLIIVIVIEKSNIPEDFKSGIGGGDRCFFKDNMWMELLYFRGPLLITISFNTVVFILTFKKIYEAQKETSRVLSNCQSRKNINSQKSKILLFLRLFIIMGVSWMMEFISWLARSDHNYLLRAVDVCNGMQGLLIFILFVLRRRVKNMLLKKYYTMRGIPRKIRRMNTNTTSLSEKISEKKSEK